jgi:hypothetical protein
MDIGHFVLIVRSTQGLLIIDPPSGHAHLVVQVAIAGPLKSFSGEFMVLDREFLPRITIEKRDMDLGVVEASANELLAYVDYANSGNSKLIINGAKASCTCLLGIQSGSELEPGKSGRLALRFDRKALGTGANERAVLLSTNDPANPSILVKSHFRVNGSIARDEIKVIPLAIDFGRNFVSASVRMSEEVIVKVPGKWVLPQGIKPESTDPSLEIKATAVTGAASGSDGDQVFRYEVKWSSAVPLGEVRYEVKFSLVRPDGEEAVIVVPVRAQFVPNNEGLVSHN